MEFTREVHYLRTWEQSSHNLFPPTPLSQQTYREESSTKQEDSLKIPYIKAIHYSIQGI